MQPHAQSPAPLSAVPSRPRVGLVLGAGGIRGCAHPAAVAVLQDAGIPIDLVVGASAGSIFGLGVAAGVPGEQMAHTVRSLTALDMLRFYQGRLRPSHGNPIGRLLLEAGAGKHFEDLPLPFGVAATDMATHQPVLFRSGEVLPAVQASIAVPFAARPVRLNGAVYSDGGLVETAPIDFAREMGADLVIAVCLGGNYRAPDFARHPRMRTFLERTGRQPGPVTDRLRDQVRFGCRLWLAALDPFAPARGADVLILPDFGRLSPNSPAGARFCCEQGEAAARSALPAIRSAIVNHHLYRESP